MNRSSMIELLESRELFSAYTLQNCMVSSFRAAAPPVEAAPAAIMGDLHQPLSYCMGGTIDARPHE
jgi:hypothetical protein